MKEQFNHVQRRTSRRSPVQARFDGRLKAQQQKQRESAVQLIYAHIPPAVVLAAEKHLRAQTNIEQRARQLWLSRGCRPVGDLGDWLRAECVEVQKLCQALLNRNSCEPARLHLPMIS